MSDPEPQDRLDCSAPYIQDAHVKSEDDAGREHTLDEHDAEPGPVGLRALCAACARLYPDQPNPLQVTARVKYWLGGPDPLDYISMYWNPGRPELRVPPHWHYISLGLSDLHGDGRVHPPPDRVLLAARRQGTPIDIQSGFGLEMTFRLASEPGVPPPTWPAALLQTLARYVFRTGAALCAGDHISWHSPLDGVTDKPSRLRHMLVCEEPQLDCVATPLGNVQFVQVVGATGRELRAAQRGTGAGVLGAMRSDAACGGAWLVTDMRRRASARGLGGRRQGPAELAGVSTTLRWAEWAPDQIIEEEASEDGIPLTVEEEIKTVLQKGLLGIRHGASGNSSGAGEERSVPVGQDVKVEGGTCKMSTDSLVASVPAASSRTAPPRAACSTDSLKTIFTGINNNNNNCDSKDAAMSTDSFGMRSVERALLEELDTRYNSTGHSQDGALSPRDGPCPEEVRVLSGVHIVFNAEGGSLLPLALQGRVLHSRHFTWRCSSGARAVTFVSEAVSGALVSPLTPYVATHQGWLQVLLPEWLAREMCERVSLLEHVQDSEDEDEDERAQGAPTLPLVLQWPRSGPAGHELFDSFELVKFEVLKYAINFSGLKN